MFKVFAETSKFVFLLKKVWNGYYSMERWVDEVYGNSRTHRLAEKLRDRIKVCFRYSFLGVVTEIKEDRNFQVLYESKFVRWILGLYNKRKEIFIRYLTYSESVHLAEEAKNEFRKSPVKTVSIIIIIAIAANIGLSILLKKEIRLLEWLVRLALLFVGLGGIFCDAKLDEVKKASFILSKIDENDKNSTYNRSA